MLTGHVMVKSHLVPSVVACVGEENKHQIIIIMHTPKFAEINLNILTSLLTERMTVIGHVVPREWCAMVRRINIKSSFGTPNIMHRSILSTYKENNLGRNMHKLLRSILGKRLLNFYALLSKFHSLFNMRNCL